MKILERLFGVHNLSLRWECRGLTRKAIFPHNIFPQRLYNFMRLLRFLFCFEKCFPIRSLQVIDDMSEKMSERSIYNVKFCCDFTFQAAETGSGKTGAFCLPVLQIVWEALRDQLVGKVHKPSSSICETFRLIRFLSREYRCKVETYAKLVRC